MDIKITNNPEELKQYKKELLDTALSCASEGMKVVPLYKRKNPNVPEDSDYLYTPLSEDAIIRRIKLKGTVGIGIACNDFYGIDFDCHEGQDIESVFNAFIADEKAEYILQHNALPIVKTVSGGFHIYFRCEKRINGDTMAYWPKTGKTRSVKIEIRGHGQYIAVFPTAGYELIGGVDVVKTAFLEEDEAQYLLDLSRTFDETINEAVESKSKSKSSGLWPVKFDVSSPWGRFNEEGADEVKRLLESKGWTKTGKRGYIELWRRPDKDKGHSATFGYCHNMFFQWSMADTGLPRKKGLNPFSILINLKFNGDKNKAIDYLRKKYDMAIVKRKRKQFRILQYIKDVFHGDVSEFLKRNVSVFNNTPVGIQVILVMQEQFKIKDFRIETGMVQYFNEVSDEWIDTSPFHFIFMNQSLFLKVLEGSDMDSIFDIAMLTTANKFVMIGNDYFEVGKYTTVVKRQTIKDRLSTEKIFPYIERFTRADVFPNYPEVEPWIGDELNLFSPWEFRADRTKESVSTDDFPTIKKIIEHVFEEDKDFGYDYMKILITMPTVRVPAVALATFNRNTGKSTIIKLFALLMGKNFKSISSKQLVNRFNKAWAHSRLVVIDESHFTDDKEALSTIKELTTAPIIRTELKLGDMDGLNCHVCIFLISNSPSGFMKVEKNEDRFAVFRLKTIHKDKMDIDIDDETRLKKEIPFFIRYLEDREFHYKRAGRFYFAREDYCKSNVQALIDDAEPEGTERVVEMILSMIDEEFVGTKLSITNAVNNFEQYGNTKGSSSSGTIYPPLKHPMDTKTIREVLNWHNIENSGDKNLYCNDSKRRKRAYVLGIDAKDKLIDLAGSTETRNRNTGKWEIKR